MTRTVLVVCTANVCRSPMAAALLARQLQATRSPTAVISAGTNAVDAAVASEAVAVLSDLGIDIAGHRARLLSRADLDEADLVLVMERAHVAHVVATSADVFGKTFCLRELATNAANRGARRADEGFEEWLANAPRASRSRCAPWWHRARCRRPNRAGPRRLRTLARQLDGLRARSRRSWPERRSITERRFARRSLVDVEVGKRRVDRITLVVGIPIGDAFGPLPLGKGRCDPLREPRDGVRGRVRVHRGQRNTRSRSAPLR